MVTKSISLMMVAAVLATVPAIAGQDNGQGSQNQKQQEAAALQTITMYPLKHAGTRTVAQAVEKMLGARGIKVATDARTGTVIVRASESDHEQIQALITELDVPAGGPEGSSSNALTLKAYRFEHVGAHESRELVKKLVEEMDPEYSQPVNYISTSPDGRSILVVATAGGHARVAEVVQAIDTPSGSEPAQPAQSLSLQFFFLRGYTGSEEMPRAKELPSNLRSIQNTLTASGFGKLSMLVPMRIQISNYSRFQQSASARATTVQGEPVTLGFEISGTPVLSDDQETVQLKLDFGVTSRFPGGTASSYGAKTTLTLTIGKYAVLAAAPSPNAEDETMAIVVRVTKE